MKGLSRSADNCFSNKCKYLEYYKIQRIYTIPLIGHDINDGIKIICIYILKYSTSSNWVFDFLPLVLVSVCLLKRLNNKGKIMLKFSCGSLETYEIASLNMLIRRYCLILTQNKIILTLEYITIP